MGAYERADMAQLYQVGIEVGYVALKQLDEELCARDFLLVAIADAQHAVELAGGVFGFNVVLSIIFHPAADNHVATHDFAQVELQVVVAWEIHPR